MILGPTCPRELAGDALPGDHAAFRAQTCCPTRTSVDNRPWPSTSPGRLLGMTTTPPRLLAPVLDRSPTQLQIGTEEGLVLPADPGIRTALARLDGTTSLADIAADSGLSRPAVRSLVGQLRRAGLLAGSPSDPAGAPRRLVRILGSGVLGRAFAEEYAKSPPGDLQLVDPGPPTPGLYEHTLPTAAETLRAHLRARGQQRVSTAPHWYRPEAPAPDITVITFDRLECDRAITDTLLRADQPHLFVRPLSDGVIVGPLVVPGTTCCTRCMDLVRSRDRAWPRILAQLCLRDCAPPRELLSWAAATALLQVRAWLSGGRPEALGATLEIRTNRWTVAQRHWPSHPDCGCGELHDR